MTSSTPGGLAASSDLPAAAAAAGGAPRVVATWLLVCCTLVFALIVVGGVTRLTHSGLSITEWQPIVGTLPPLSESQWNEAFAKYQTTPEYLQVNRGMSIDAFKGIFWVEYVHRLLGRLVGFAFIAPLLWSGLIHSILGIVNPVLNQRIDWLWFVASQVGFGIVAGIVVSWQGRIRTLQHLPLALRSGMEASGMRDENRGEDDRR